MCGGEKSLDLKPHLKKNSSIGIYIKGKLMVFESILKTLDMIE